jgi:hypothetical protein
MIVKIAQVLDSANWESAVVIVPVCGHRSVRPRNMNLHAGDDFDCPFCDDADEPVTQSVTSPL